MENLPAKPAPNSVSATTSNGPELRIWQAGADEIASLLGKPPVTLEWTTGQLRMVEATFFVPEMSGVERRAWIKTYHDALSDLPGPFVAEAWNHVIRTKASKPSPADVRNRATSMLAEARKRRHCDQNPGPVVHDKPKAPASPETAAWFQMKVEEMNRRVARKLRWGPAKHTVEDGREDESDTGFSAKPMSDREIELMIAANPARKGMTVEQVRRAERIGRP